MLADGEARGNRRGMTLRLRLLADDLAGTLQAALRFTGVAGPVSCGWTTAGLPASAALDSRTRERAPHHAAARCRAWATTLGEGELSFYALDAYLRGNPAAEIAALLAAGPFTAAIVVPPAGEGMPPGEAVSTLTETFRGLGSPATEMQAGGAVPEGISLWLAEQPEQLARIIAAGREASGSILWCGGIELAEALAGAPPRSAALPAGPLLGFLGSAAPATVAQFAAASPLSLTMAEGEKPDRIQRRLQRYGSAFLRLNLPAGTPRAEAARRTEVAFGGLLRRMPAPAALLVAGGETLRGMVGVLGAEALVVQGEVFPGLPLATLRGGVHDGLSVVYKPGGFGPTSLLADLAGRAKAASPG